MKGKFITLEGVEGVGKSTNMEFIESILSGSGIPYIKEDFDSTAELLLIFAARAQHLQQKIIPALNAGTWVLSDRFTDATYAYQGGGRQLSMQTISALEDIVQHGLTPDLTIILDLPVDIGLQRAAKRSDKDRFESEKVEFFDRVRAVYLNRAKQNPSRYVLVDASRPLPEVQEQIRHVMKVVL